MEGLSVAANAFAVVSIAIQLGESCVKLYRFWESMEDAPQEIASIIEDLQYLISVFKKFEDSEKAPGDCIVEGIHHCQSKIADLMLIVESFDDGLRSTSRRRRIRTAFKAALHTKHVQRFRESLDATKSTLTLAMVHEWQVLHPQVNANPSNENSIIQMSRQGNRPPQNMLIELPPSYTEAQNKDDSLVLSRSRRPDHIMIPRASRDVVRSRAPRSVKTHTIAKNTLKAFEKAVPQQILADFTVQELMLHAISQTAVASFETSSFDILAKDGYTFDEFGMVRSKTFVYSDDLRYRVDHRSTSLHTALGCVRIRKTYVRCADEFTAKLGQTHTITSVVFYPARWLQRLGLRTGFEAITACAGKSWLCNCRITVTRAVAEDSPIFSLCSAGETRAVKLLLENGQASVVDTTPQGWKPLHFAAKAGHTDLCAMLIQAGADKGALVYEGPTDSILSPISIFVSHGTERTAEDKIAMLRLFCDCIDLSDPDSDGWLVHEWLKKAYAKERKPISQNSITWLLHLTANEQFVEFSSRNVWSALQHAVRSVLNHARCSRVLLSILDPSDEQLDGLSLRHLDALSGWLALRVKGRVILPMGVNAGAFLQMKGFDWVEDEMPHRMFMQALPNIYAAWCHAVLDAVEQVEMYMREELGHCLNEMGVTSSEFLELISTSSSSFLSLKEREVHGMACTSCGDNYSNLAHGLVEPARIAVTECVATGHWFDCRCQDLDSSPPSTPVDELPAYRDFAGDNDTDQCGSEEDKFFDAQPYLFPNTIEPDPFSDIATMLYRAQGRSWMSSYAVNERLCGTCFLFRERYIGEDGLAADFPPMPKSFEGLRVKS